MTTIRKSVRGILLCLAMLLVSACTLISCGSKENASVTFMVQNENGAWEQYAQVDAKDGKVTLPQDPTKTNYVFRDWYDYSETPTPFRNDGLTGAVTVYAYFVPAQVQVSVNGGESEQKKLEELDALTWQYTADALKYNLSFDGWYTDASYAVKYEVGADVTELFGRYLAHVTFGDGYQNALYEADIPVGEKLTAPGAAVAKDSDGNDVSFESKYILQSYMDPVSVSYVADGNSVNFDKAVSGNMTIRVRWQTPGLGFSRDSDSGNYYLDFVDSSVSGIKDFPVVSILSSNAVVDQEETEDGIQVTYGNVTGVMAETLGSNFSGAKVFLFDEGIEWIAKFNGSEASELETVQLPSTLKVLERSFNVMPRLKSVTLPSKLVSVLDCFWAEYETTADVLKPKSDKAYDFEIAIPDSVTNIARLPENVTFGEKSVFTRDESDSRIYLVNGTDKVLVSDYQKNVKDGVLEIPSGVTKIQVGLYSAIEADVLKLPATVTQASYNASVSIVPGYNGATKSRGGLLYRPNVIADPTRDYAGADWFSVVSTLGEGIGRVEIDNTKMPTKFKNFNFVYSTSNYDTLLYSEMNGYPVVFTKEIAEGTAVTVNIFASSEMTGFSKSYSSKKLLKSGEKLTKETIAEVLGLNDLPYAYVITELSELNGDFDPNATVTRNLYITLRLEYDKYGITTSENADGTLTVTGFDSANAQQVPGEEGLYIVNIPAAIDGKKITAIAAGAFMDNENIAQVYIKNSVKVIGENAFRNTANLRLVVIEQGGLEEIGSYAFGDAGCYLDPVQNLYVASGELNVTIPLANLKSIAPYAFKTRAIKMFTPVAGEEGRYLLAYPWSKDYVYPNAQVGDFFFVCGGAGNNYGIVKYTGSEVVKKNSAGGEVDVTVYDVQYLATAGGYAGGSDTFAIGRTMRYYESNWPVAGTAVMRYEMMEGSAYYVTYGVKNQSFNEITLGIVKKIHKNAFTDMGIERFAYFDNADAFDSWTTKDQITSQDSTIFEDGWWQGMSNEVMKEKLADIERFTNSSLN